MSEEIKKEPEAQETEQQEIDPVELFSKGKLKLARPIKADNVDFTELEYDFRALTGMEFARCMDRGVTTRNNTFNMTDQQAIEVFAAAVAKKMEGIDAADIRERLSVEDAIKAMQLTTTFFVAATQEGNKRISSGRSK